MASFKIPKIGDGTRVRKPANYREVGGNARRQDMRAKVSKPSREKNQAGVSKGKKPSHDLPPPKVRKMPAQASDVTTQDTFGAIDDLPEPGGHPKALLDRSKAKGFKDPTSPFARMQAARAALVGEEEQAEVDVPESTDFLDEMIQKRVEIDRPTRTVAEQREKLAKLRTRLPALRPSRIIEGEDTQAAQKLTTSPTDAIISVGANAGKADDDGSDTTSQRSPTAPMGTGSTTSGDGPSHVGATDQRGEAEVNRSHPVVRDGSLEPTPAQAAGGTTNEDGLPSVSLDSSKGEAGGIAVSATGPSPPTTPTRSQGAPPTTPLIPRNTTPNGLPNGSKQPALPTPPNGLPTSALGSDSATLSIPPKEETALVNTAKGLEEVGVTYKKLGDDAKKAGTSLTMYNERQELDVGMLLGPLSGVVCNNCPAAEQCSEFKENSTCAFDAEFSALPTRDLDNLVPTMETIADLQRKRAMRAVFLESKVAGGQLDPNVTRQLEIAAFAAERVARLKTPQQVSGTRSVTVVSQGGPAQGGGLISRLLGGVSGMLPQASGMLELNAVRVEETVNTPIVPSMAMTTIDAHGEEKKSE